MLKLYQFATSPFCEKIRRILHFKQVPYELVEVDRLRVADYVEWSPYGKFPAICHDGKAVNDSTNIAAYLESVFPDRAILPVSSSQRAMVHVLEDWADESLYFYEIVMRFCWEHNLDRIIPQFAAAMPSVPVEIVRSRLHEAAIAGTKVQGLGRKSQAEIVADVAQHFAAIAGLLEDSAWLVGDAVTLADIAVGSQVTALRSTEEVTDMLHGLPRVRQWLDRLDEVAPAHL